VEGEGRRMGRWEGRKEKKERGRVIETEGGSKKGKEHMREGTVGSGWKGEGREGKAAKKKGDEEYAL
jgi:hypothetical protein